MGAKLYSQYKNRSNTTLLSKNVNYASFDSVHETVNKGKK